MARSIPDPGFAGDDGSPDPALLAALSGYGSGGPAAGVLAALAATRVLVPVVAVLDSDGDSVGALRVEKDSSMATMTITGRDGRVALLAFTGTAALQAWDPAARPVPVSGREAAAAAIDQGADALLLDVAGPVPFPVDGSGLRAVAAGYGAVRQEDGSYAWVVPVSRTPDR